MVKNMLKYVDADIILWAHATNPFIDHLIYNKAIKLFMSSSKNFDSLEYPAKPRWPLDEKAKFLKGAGVKL